MTIRPLTADDADACDAIARTLPHFFGVDEGGATIVSGLTLAAPEPGETRPPGWDRAALLLVRPLVVAP